MNRKLDYIFGYFNECKVNLSQLCSCLCQSSIKLNFPNKHLYKDRCFFVFLNNLEYNKNKI